MTSLQHAQALARVRLSSQVRRAAAWAQVPETVLGLPLSPITPATASLLMGTRNAFLCGLPPIEADVKNFILFHSPDFDIDKPTPKWLPRLRIAFRTERALCPFRTLKSRRKAVRAARFLQAVREIREIVEETWADALPASVDDKIPEGNPLAASQQAQMVHIFSRDFKFWPLATPISNTPLRQLFQLCRCSDRAYHDRAEAALDRQFLASLNPGS